MMLYDFNMQFKFTGNQTKVSIPGWLSCQRSLQHHQPDVADKHPSPACWEHTTTFKLVRWTLCKNWNSSGEGWLSDWTSHLSLSVYPWTRPWRTLLAPLHTDLSCLRPAPGPASWHARKHARARGGTTSTSVNVRVPRHPCEWVVVATLGACVATIVAAEWLNTVYMADRSLRGPEKNFFEIFNYASFSHNLGTAQLTNSVHRYTFRCLDTRMCCARTTDGCYTAHHYTSHCSYLWVQSLCVMTQH